jgi:hypothetical protein
MEKKTVLQVSSLPGYEAEIGRLLWCLEDVRRNLITGLSGIDRDLLDRKIGKTLNWNTFISHCIC